MLKVLIKYFVWKVKNFVLLGLIFCSGFRLWTISLRDVIVGTMHQNRPYFLKWLFCQLLYYENYLITVLYFVICPHCDFHLGFCLLKSILDILRHEDYTHRRPELTQTELTDVLCFSVLQWQLSWIGEIVWVEPFWTESKKLKDSSSPMTNYKNSMVKIFPI